MKIFKKVRLIILCLLPLLICLSLINYKFDEDPRIEKIIQHFNIFRNNFEQQKIYLQTDKEIYMAGETIWLKSYLLNASALLPDSVSKDIYIELLDFNDKPVSSIILRNKSGFSAGDMSLKDTLLAGNYHLRAYTNWMRNFDRDYLFYKTISIKNPNYENVVTRDRLKEIKRMNRMLQRTENRRLMTFFPEGGNLVEGLPGKVAFKAENGFGIGLNVKGTIYDNKGNQIVNFQSVHDGLGIFEFTPQPKLKYIAKIIFENGKKDKFLLPAALKSGIVMSVDNFEKDNIKIIIRANRPVSNNIASNEVIIVAQSRGLINFISKGEIKDKPVLSVISKKLLPAGITQITLFDGRGEPICERLVFTDQKVETGMNQISFSTRNSVDSMICKAKITNNKGNPVNGNFSVSVVENLHDTSMQRENILTSLLLTSDLKGRINNPSYYFDKNNPEAANRLDLVMMTHGWRRFVWKEILTGKYPRIDYQKEGGLIISGKITRDFFGIPISNSKVILSILSTYNDTFQTLTNNKGKFEFPMMDYEDTIHVRIEAFKPTGGKGVQIILGDTLTPQIAYKPYPSYLETKYNKKKIKQNTKREITNNKKGFNEKPADDNAMGKIYDTPNTVMQVGEDVDAYTNILQYMQGKLPGVSIIGNRVIIRGINTIYGSTDPLFLMDGVPIDAGSVPNINPSDISSIDVLKGPEASIYGSRGANGVIAFNSKRGHFMKRGIIEFGMLGYHKTREFYVPPYDSWTYKPDQYHVPRTAYWKPNVFTDSTGLATIRFKKKFTATEYVITLEGITESGEIIHYNSSIQN